ncbi:putative bifunctional diguanylate cyclase/phosphodiesterase [Aliikangiella sp. IMCC44632]
MEFTEPINSIVLLFAISIGALLVTAVSLFLVNYFTQTKFYFKVLVAMCLVGIAYQTSTLLYYFSYSTAEAVWWLKIQNSTILTFFPLCFYIIGYISEQANLKRWFTLVAIVSASLVLVNLILPYGIRFDSINQLKQVELLWGGKISYLDAKQSKLGMVFFLLFPAFFVWSGYRCYRLLLCGKVRESVLLTAVMLSLMVCAYHGNKIDNGEVVSFYFIGFSFLFIVLFLSVEFGFYLKKKSDELVAKSQALVKETESKARIQKLISSMAMSVTNSDSSDFFDDQVLSIAKTFDCKYVFMGLIDKNNPRSIETISVAGNAQLIDNFCFSLNDTPSMQPVAESMYFIEDNAMQVFEDDWLIRKLSVDSFIGCPIFNNDKELVGIVVLLDEKPLNDVNLVSEILSIFTSRVSAELQRIKADNRNKLIAYQDYATGLPNRAQLNSYIRGLLRILECEESQHALFLVDLDNFKIINEAVGTKVGDQILRKISRRLTSRFAEQAFISRFGGDEFVLIFNRFSEKIIQECEGIAQKIINEVAQPLQIGERIIQIGCSLGITIFPLHTNQESEVLRYAENSLLQAKEKGKGSFKIFDPEIQMRIDEKRSIQKELHQGLINKEFIIFYQPQIKADGTVLGAEALVRWKSPKRGFVPPAFFIPIAEETGFIHKLGDWIIDTCLSHMHHWKRRGLKIPGHISINVSTWQFSQPGFVVGLINKIKALNILPEEIVIELTETGLLKDIEQTYFKLRLLKHSRIKVALDDFGTGYSSLAYLRDLPVDILKIDKAFIDHIHQPEDNGLVESIIAISQHMHMGLIAEGVETEQQVKILSDMHCDAYQGYFYAKPMSEPNFCRWVKNYASPSSPLGIQNHQAS